MLKTRFATLLWPDIQKPTFLFPPLWINMRWVFFGESLFYVQVYLGLPTRELKRSFQKLKRNRKQQEPKSGWQSKYDLSSCSLTHTTLRDSHWEAVWHHAATISKASNRSLRALFPLFARDSAPTPPLIPATPSISLIVLWWKWVPFAEANYLQPVYLQVSSTPCHWLPAKGTTLAEFTGKCKHSS